MWRIPPCLVPERPQVTIHSRPRYGGCAPAPAGRTRRRCSPPPRAEPAARSQRAALLVERCLYTEQGWAEAEDALRTAEALARSDDERGAAACERGQLAYAATLLGVRDRADEARAALGRAAALLAAGRAGPAAAGLPPRADRREPRRLPAGGPRRLPAGARGRDARTATAAAVVHLAPSGRTRPARRGVGGGPARLRRVAADPGGAAAIWWGRPPRWPSLADAESGAGGVAAARGGGAAVPAARGRAHVAGAAVGSAGGRRRCGGRNRSGRRRLGPCGLRAVPAPWVAPSVRRR